MQRKMSEERMGELLDELGIGGLMYTIDAVFAYGVMNDVLKAGVIITQNDNLYGFKFVYHTEADAQAAEEALNELIPQYPYFLEIMYDAFCTVYSDQIDAFERTLNESNHVSG